MKKLIAILFVLMALVVPAYAATTAFPITDSHILAAHRKSELLAFSIYAFNPQDDSPQYRFSATGTACTVRIYLQFAGPTFEVNVDSGGFADCTLPGTGAWSDMTLFTGLSDTAHTVIFRRKNASNQVTYAGYYFFDHDSFLSVTGSAPALAAPNIGAYFLPFSSAVLQKNGMIDGFFDWEYNTTLGSSNGYGYFPSLNTNLGVQDVAATFHAKTSALAVFGYCSAAQKYTLLIDGVAGSQVTSANSSRFDWTTISTSLDGANDHEYQLVLSGDQTVNYLGVYAISLTSSTSLQTHSYSPRGRLVVLGDSISMGVGPGDTTAGYARKIANLTGRRLLNHSTSGRSLTGNTSNGIGTLHFFDDIGIRDVTSDDVAIILLGANDVQVGWDATTFGKVYQDALQKLLDAGFGKVIAIDVLPSGNGTISSRRAVANAAIATAVSNIGNAKCVEFPTDGVINTTTDLEGDGIHPTAAAQDKIVAALQASAQAVPSYAAPYTAAANVRNGTDRGDGVTGTLVVPVATNVKSGVVYDNGTTGTYTASGGGGGGSMHIGIDYPHPPTEHKPFIKPGVVRYIKSREEVMQ